MGRKSKRQRWTAGELEKLKKYILSKSSQLRLYFYQNIIEGEIKFKKCSRFFIEMSELMKRTANQCKSKFQKMEKSIYTDLMGVSAEHYRLYQRIRRLNSELKVAEDKRFIPKPKHRMLRKIRHKSSQHALSDDAEQAEEKRRREHERKAQLRIDHLERELADLRRQVFASLVAGELEMQFEDGGRPVELLVEGSSGRWREFGS